MRVRRSPVRIFRIVVTVIAQITAVVLFSDPVYMMFLQLPLASTGFLPQSSGRSSSSRIQATFPSHHAPFLFFSIVSKPEGSNPLLSVNQVSPVSPQSIVVTRNCSVRRDRWRVAALGMSRCRLGIRVRRGRGPARCAESGRVQHGVVHIDKTVSNPVLDIRQI